MLKSQCWFRLLYIGDPDVIPGHTTCLAASLTWCTPRNLLPSLHHVRLFKGTHVATYIHGPPRPPPQRTNTPYDARVIRINPEFNYR